VKPAEPPRELEAKQSRFHADVRALGVQSSRDVAPTEILGDARGEAALRMSLNLRGPGYHAYVCGLEGPARLERIADWIRPQVARVEPLRDWVYVHNFAEPDRPRAIRLVAGDGRRLRSELDSLLRALRHDLPRAFREEAFESEKAEIVQAFQERHQKQQETLETIAREAGFALSVTPQGMIAIVPLVNGRPAQSEEDFRSLGPERIAELEKNRRALANDLREFVAHNIEEQHRLDEEVRRIERGFAARIVRSRAQKLVSGFDEPEVGEHVEQLVEHVLDHLGPFRGEAESPPAPFAFLLDRESDPLSLYAVNVVVDNSQTDTTPVRVIDSPTYKNLFGTIDRQSDRFGRVTTDFRQIHAGALLEADGGVLVLQAEDVLVEPFVWRILRRALRSGRVEIEAYDPFVGFSPASGLRPEPIQVDTKVVLVGPRWLFETLLEADLQFRDLFKVFADFSPVVERNAESTLALCGRVAKVARDEGLPEFDADALAALVELGVREADDSSRIKVGSERVLDTAREAAARARQAGLQTVTRKEVAQATREHVHRLDRVEVVLREAIARGHLLLEVAGNRIGQANGLAVSELGGYAFGRPTRVTATVGMGAEGVVSIDREIKLSGATHDKGVMILASFLRDRFARTRPLSLMASVVFEQSYGPIDGDSASLTELVAILSRIGDFDLRQDLSVTGSVNQRGEVQAVGGINEKIEGFYDCCRMIGLSGQQGVVFPAANVDHVNVREDVEQAIAEGRFHLYPVASVDEALEVLTGLRAGSPIEPDTLNFRVDDALEHLAVRLKEFSRT